MYEHKIFFLAYGSDYYDTGHSHMWFEHKKIFLAYGSDIITQGNVSTVAPAKPGGSVLKMALWVVAARKL